MNCQIHILSFLGVQKAGITSVLSKRWKYLWSELPSLEFMEGEVYSYWDTKDERNFVSWVNRTIDIREGKYLEKFLVDMDYKKNFCSDVDDAWVEFSVKNKVKELILMLCTPMDVYYTLPHVMYSCSSLTTLSLKSCSMLPYEGTMAWQSLTKLTLVDVILSQHLLDEILTSCPVLNSLELDMCGGFTRLEVKSRCLDSVMIEEYNREPSFVEISAPYVCVLKITVFRHRRKWQLRNISSVVTASVNFLYADYGFLEVMDNAKEFIDNFKHVSDLHLLCECFEILSERTVNGRYLPQFKKLRHLEINSCSGYSLGISGIFNMLDSSPNLETLLLVGFETEGEIFVLDETGKVDLEGDLLHLKKVRVNNFADPKGEPLLMLARILLRRAPVLEEMVMVIDVVYRREFTKISRTLLTFPRSSPKAEIHLSHSRYHDLNL